MRISELFFELGALGVDFWCLVVKLKTLGIAIRPLSDDFRPLRIYFRPLASGYIFLTRKVDFGPLPSEFGLWGKCISNLAC